jgi:Protein of unknown function (DUF1186)/SEC-C motif
MLGDASDLLSWQSAVGPSAPLILVNRPTLAGYRMPQPTMETDEILERLEVFSTPFPYDAVGEAILRREQIAPRLVRILEETVEQASRRAHQEPVYMAHLYAMFLLAQFRDRRAYAPLIALAGLPGDLTELLLGDAQCEHLPKALASVWDGDLDPIKTLIEDEAANEYSRMAGLGAIVTLVCAGEVSRDIAMAYFAELFDDRLRAPGSVWGELVCSACDLHPGELYPRIVRAYQQNLVDETMVGLDAVRAQGRSKPEKVIERTRRSSHHNLIRDTVKEMESWACFQEPEIEFEGDQDGDEPRFDWTDSGEDGYLQPIRRAQPKIGRNEPCPCGSGKKFKKCCGQ